MMLTIKMMSVAAVALVATTATATYFTTTILVKQEIQQPADELNACQAALNELRAAREHREAQEDAAKKYFNNEPFKLDQGRQF